MAEPTRRQEFWARVIIWSHVMAAVLSVILLIGRRPGRQLSSTPELLATTMNLPVTPSLASVALLSIVAGGLIRRKRVALIAAAILQAAGGLFSLYTLAVLADLVPGADPASPFGVKIVSGVGNGTAVLVAVLALMAFQWLRPSFPAKLAPGSVKPAVLVAVLGFAATLLVTHLIAAAYTASLAGELQVLAHSFGRSLGLVDSTIQLHERVPRWLPLLTGFMMGTTIILSFLALSRSAHLAPTWSPEEELELRALLSEFGGRDSLSYFATRRDKELVFSPDRRAAIAFRVIGSVALASGDPVGDPAAWPDAIRAFGRRVRAYGWVPSVISVSEDGARAYADTLGLSVAPMGDEAILELESMDLSTTQFTPVRRAVRHAEQAGLTARLRRLGDLSDDELTVLTQRASAWRQGEERGFSMALGRVGDRSDDRCLIVEVREPAGTLVAFQTFVPWGPMGASLDLMRRSPTAPGGVNELIVATLIREGEEVGLRRVSLNFAMFRGVFAASERVGAGTVTKISAGLLSRMVRWFQLERLYRANQKYHPLWQPRFFCADDLLTLARAGLAAGIAEGFVPWPQRADRSHLLRLSPEQTREAQRLAELTPAVEVPVLRRVAESRQRVRQVDELASAGLPAYPVGLPAPLPFADAHAAITSAAPVTSATPAPAASSAAPSAEPELAADAGPASGTAIRVAGRVLHRRRLGGVAFLVLTFRGQRIQVLLDAQRVGGEQMRALHLIATGDIVWVEGEAGRSRTGEPSLLATRWAMASKVLQPIPFGSFEDPEARVRKRSTDMIVHPRVGELLAARSRVMAQVRALLGSEGFAEVETPILNTVHGGASARPFRTRINAYGTDLTLRIAPELFLKRLLVGEMGRIFEIARNFRNEGADATHNPEFTALEAYAPFWDYTDMARLTESLIKRAAREVHGREALPIGPEGALVDVSAPWPRVRVLDAVSEHVGHRVAITDDIDALLALAARHEVPIGPGMGPGAIIEELYGELVEPDTLMPTFYMDFPKETSPLTAPHRTEAGLVERWDLVGAGMELGTAYSELTDPLEQRARFTEQSIKAAAGDPEAMEIDNDFLLALENGMPPAGGLGIGMDRLVMLLTGTSIRDVLTFPFVRPER